MVGKNGERKRLNQIRDKNYRWTIEETRGLT
jgi:hypothetical protein